MRAVHWECETCKQFYDNEQAALDCECWHREEEGPPSVKPGDIVLAHAGFGCYDGERAWVANARRVDPRRSGHPSKWHGAKCKTGSSNCFGPCCTFEFYYVVTAVDRDEPPHYVQHEPAHRRWRYHLVTLAMKGGYRTGWTYDEGHHKPRLVKRPPLLVRRQGAVLVGEHALRLL